MAIPKNRPDRELQKFAENSDGNTAVRVIITAANPADLPGPSNINLSGDEISESASPGTFIGNLTVVDGIAPFTFTITDDPDNKFQIDGNDLELAGGLDFDTANQHNVTIEVQDDNGKTFEKSFLINVIEAVAVGDKEVVFNGIDEYAETSNIPEIDVGNVAFSIAFEVTRLRQDVEETIFSMQNAGGNNTGFRIFFSASNELNYGFYEDRSLSQGIIRRLNPNHNINDKKFYVITYDGSKTVSGFNGHINGSTFAESVTLNTLSTSNITSNTRPFRLGANSDDSEYFQGRIDNVMIFSKVLTASEITTLYNGGDPLEDLTGNGSILASNIVHVPITSTDTYPTLVDQRGYRNITMNANMSQSNIVDSGAIS